MEIAHERRERNFIRFALGIVFGVIAFVFLCWGAYRGYSSWEQKRLVRRAAAFLAGGDLKDATLSAQQAFQMQPTAEAARVMAQIAERGGDKSALDWWRKALELGGGTAQDGYRFVAASIQFGDPASAEYVRELVTVGEQDKAPFQAAIGRIADTKHEQKEAENQWQRAVELDPTNQSYRFEWAVIRLKSKDAAAGAAARSDLEQMRHDISQRAAATRTLILDGVANHAPAERIRDWAKELQSYPERQFNDRLLYLSILKQMQDVNFTSYLTSTEADAVARPTELASLIIWMNSNGLPALAIDFLNGLDEENKSKWPVPLAAAEAYARIADWSALERLTKKADWLAFEFLRHAFLTRVYRSTDKQVLAAHEWAEAQKAASIQPEMLLTLNRTVAEWGWQAESMDLLWALTKFPQTRREALQNLYQRYSRNLDSNALYRVMSQLSELDPGNLDVQNNLVQISLLLNINTDQSRKRAAEIYRKQPENPAYASTYAYALFSNGKTGEAVRVMQALPDEARREPAIATYYGIFLAAAGDREKARIFLEIANRSRLLPEEKKLVEQARLRAGI